MTIPTNEHINMIIDICVCYCRRKFIFFKKINNKILFELKICYQFFFTKLVDTFINISEVRFRTLPLSKRVNSKLTFQSEHVKAYIKKITVLDN